MVQTAADADRTFFIVRDDKDGKSYKVFLRKGDLPRLKVGKIRKTMRGVASIDPAEGFTLVTEGGRILGVDDEQELVLDVGLAAESTVLLLRKRPMLVNVAFEEPASSSVANVIFGGPPLEANPIIRQRSHSPPPRHHVPDYATQQPLNDETSPVARSGSIPLTEAQLALQQRLYEEAMALDMFQSNVISLQDIVGPDQQLPVRSQSSGCEHPTTAPPSSRVKSAALDLREGQKLFERPWSIGQQSNSRSPEKTTRSDPYSQRRSPPLPPTPSAEKELERAGTMPLNEAAAALVESLKDDVENLLAKIATHRSEKSLIQREADHLRRRLHDAESKCEEHESKCAVLIQKLIAHSGESADTNTKKSKLFDDLSRQMDQAAQLFLATRENDALRKKLAEETSARRALHNTVEQLRGNIRVIVRLRPSLVHSSHHQHHYHPSSSASVLLESHDVTCPNMVFDSAKNLVVASSSTLNARSLEFYRVLTGDASQEEVFAEVEPMVRSALDGANTCLLAYGQTGSGKTHTVLGSTSGGERNDGIVPRFIRALFHALNASSSPSFTAGATGFQFSVSCSFVELYNDQLFDLLASNTETDLDLQYRAPTCDIRTSNGQSYMIGVTAHPVASCADALELLEVGSRTRRVESTRQNALSSRSHAVFSLELRTMDGLLSKSTVSKAVFVDLAGSERVSKSLSVGDRLKEAQFINKSLCALGDVVAALTSKSSADQSGPPSFVPYRNSKLTTLLQDCLGGSSKAILVACVAPNDHVASGVESNAHETWSTLNFASRVKCVRNYAERSRVALKKLHNNSCDEIPLHPQPHQALSKVSCGEIGIAGSRDVSPARGGAGARDQQTRSPSTNVRANTPRQGTRMMKF